MCYNFGEYYIILYVLCAIKIYESITDVAN